MEWLERFSDEGLAGRYPTREAYLERYEPAREGYVREEDRGRLLAEAGEGDIPEAPDAADLLDTAEQCIGHACLRESGIDLSEGGVVRLELVLDPEVQQEGLHLAGGKGPVPSAMPRAAALVLRFAAARAGVVPPGRGALPG